MSYLLSHPDLPKSVEELRSRSIEPFLSDLVALPADSSIAKVVGVLRERGVYEVFLPENKRCGLISARDVLKIGSIEATKASAYMSYVPLMSKQSSVGEIARLMTDYRIRAVPISDGRKITGQVNSVNILAKLKSAIGGDMRVTSLAASNPITIQSEASCAKARDLMIRKRIDHLPVTEETRVEGMITSNDIISHITSSERLGSKSMKPEMRGVFDFAVKDAMDKTPLACSPDSTAEQALELMLTSNRTYVLVAQWEELQGIATHRNFMSILAEVEPELDVPVFIVGLPDDPFEAEATKAKFRRIVNQLLRVFPDIVEARSVIKSKFTKPGKDRGRYEVTVQIRTSRDSYTYSEEGWELPAIYDIITNRLKRLMTAKRKPHREREREAPESL
jgi:CBS domain-containing protein